MRRPLSLLAFAAALPAIAATAQEPILLDEIVLSAGLTPLPADAYARAFSTVTADEIRDRGITTVQDALRALPGLSVNTSGAGLTQVRIRGAEANQTLILIDGVEAVGGADEYFLSGLDTDNIERIEVLRGPQSVFYGSNASAGVVNIITRRAPQGRSYGATVEVGNGGAASLSAGHRGERGGVQVILSTRDDLGYDLSGSGGDKDGLRRKTLSVTGDLAATEDLRLGLTLRRSAERIRQDDADSGAARPEDYIVDSDMIRDRDELQAGLWAEYGAADARLTHRLDWQQSVLRETQDADPEQRGETGKLKYRASLGLDGAASEARHLLNLLAEHQRDENTTAPGQSREMSSVALEFRAFLEGGVSLQAGLRHDANRVFDDFNSWNVALDWQIPDRPFRLHASAGTGLVNPSFFELYADQSFGSIAYRGNPDLRPERNRGFDIGVEAQLPGGRGSIDVTYFNETFQDEIDIVALPSQGPSLLFTYANQAGDSPREGVEVTARINASDRLSLSGSYTYLDAKNPDGSAEVRRPRHEAGLSATLAILDGRGTISGDLRHVSGNVDTRFFGDFGTGTLPAFTVANLAAGYDVTPNVRAVARISNLFDTDYSESWGYPAQGRTATVGLQARW
ncbi:TonB-dependent receptor plug domain-containing protein [Paracoccus sp. ME4]|uniref:TonB-dependent receptor plug domain-containing protein n=1 Tax=Paracoccus sp. ME4 TaxID=3138066 RepID=UPI00398A82B0